jgi:hypothetical protein
MVVPKRRQQSSSQQRAYIEASEREMPPSIATAARMPKELAELEHLLAREGQLLEQLKLQFKTGHHPASLSPQLSANPHNQELINELPLLTSEQQSKRVAQELRTILESKKIGAWSRQPTRSPSCLTPLRRSFWLTRVPHHSHSPISAGRADALSRGHQRVRRRSNNSNTTRAQSRVCILG